MTTSQQANGWIVLAFVIGLGFGYLGAMMIGIRSSVPEPQPPVGMHMMSDGTMMSNTSGTSTSMGGMMMDMTAGLQGKSGDAFDKAFLEEMVVHHEGAVDMAKLVLQHSSRPELRTLAQNIIDAQTKEIQMMKGWEMQWFTK